MLFKPIRIMIGAVGLAVAACSSQTAQQRTPDPSIPSSSSKLKAAEKTAPAARFLSRSDHFDALQSAGLKGDYAEFADLLEGADTTAIVTTLRQSFGGRPFDAYTSKSQNTQTSHKRLLELRGTGGRLYLYVELDKVSGGWNLATYDLDRSRANLVGKL